MTVAPGVGGGLATVVLRSAADERLVEHVRGGSSEAFEALFDRYHPGVLAFCAHTLGSLDEAEDAAQLTFLVAHRDLVRNAHPVALRAWLYGIARHRCLMALRARRDHPIRDVADPARRYELSAEVGVRDDVRRLLADVARLPDNQRAALVLAEIGGLSHAEIARILGCPRTKIKALVFQARSALRVARAARDIPCAQVREQLATLRGPALAHATLRRHLDDCPGCRAYRDAIRSRRRRPVPRLAWAPFVGIKRTAAGAIVVSGSGAGGSALTGGALGGAGLVVAVTIAATAGPPVGRDVAVPVRPIARAAAPASFPAQHAGSSAPAGVIGIRDTRGTPLAGSLAGTGDEAATPGTGGPSDSQEAPMERDLRGPDEPAGDADAAAPVRDPAQPVPDESLASEPPAILGPPAAHRASSGSKAAPPAPPPRPDNPHPTPTTPPRPDNPHPTPTTPSRPDNPGAAPAAPKPSPSGREGARAPKDDSGERRRETSPEKSRARPR